MPNRWPSVVVAPPTTTTTIMKSVCNHCDEGHHIISNINSSSTRTAAATTTAVADNIGKSSGRTIGSGCASGGAGGNGDISNSARRRPKIVGGEAYVRSSGSGSGGRGEQNEKGGEWREEQRKTPGAVHNNNNHACVSSLSSLSLSGKCIICRSNCKDINGCHRAATVIQDRCEQESRTATMMMMSSSSGSSSRGGSSSSSGGGSSSSSSNSGSGQGEQQQHQKRPVDDSVVSVQVQVPVDRRTGMSPHRSKVAEAVEEQVDEERGGGSRSCSGNQSTAQFFSLDWGGGGVGNEGEGEGCDGRDRQSFGVDAMMNQEEKDEECRKSSEKCSGGSGEKKQRKEVRRDEKGGKSGVGGNRLSLSGSTMCVLVVAFLWASAITPSSVSSPWNVGGLLLGPGAVMAGASEIRADKNAETAQETGSKYN